MYTNGISLQPTSKHIPNDKMFPSPNNILNNTNYPLLHETTITLDFEESETINYQNSQNNGNAENINLNVDPLKILTNIRMKTLSRPMIGHKY